jgi:hypothetical protein
VLKMTVNKSASIQTEAAALFFDTFPNRIQAAQASAMTAVAQEAPGVLMKFGRAAKYFQFAVQRTGTSGIKLTMSPATGGKVTSRSDGYNAAIGAAILLSGRRGGTVIRPKGKQALSFREGTSTHGGDGVYGASRVSPIRSKRQEISREMRDMVTRQINAHLKYVGFGSRGSIPTGPDFLNAREF